ncbi:MAG: invasion associated locus B family protein [Pseudomonadota bacterium]
MRDAARALVLAAALAPFPSDAQTPEYAVPDTAEEIGDWLLECFEAPIDQCQIYQRILLNQGAAIALVAAFAWDDSERVLRAQIALPLGIDLQRGATISTSSGYSVNAPLSRCTQQGCLIEGIVPDDMVAAFETSQSAQIAVINPDQGNFAVPLSLSGFAEALSRIRPEPVAPPTEPAPSPADAASPNQAGAGPDARFTPVTGDNSGNN